MSLFDTIVAEATAPFEAALSIVRLSGPLSGEILSKLTKKDIAKFTPRQMTRSALYNNDSQKIDEGTLVYFEKGKSYTGEESVEFYVHGSRIIVNELIETIVSYGARRAEGGEFTMKAYYNGKLSLVEAEAVNEIIKAKTYKGKELALKTLTGENSKRITEIREELLNIMARIEVDIDYPEYDDESEIITSLKEQLPVLVSKVLSLCSASKSALYFLTGVKVALVGRPNVGKSTLLNALVGYDKAIVTDIPGTTRDVVEGEIDRKGVHYRFYDTAGIRNNPDPIEKIGIEKSYNSINEADIVLYLYDVPTPEEIVELGIKDIAKPLVKVQNKIDITKLDKSADINISAISKEVESIYKVIEERLDISETAEGGFASKRDLDLLFKFSDELIRAKDELVEGWSLDVVETLLLDATHILDELLGNEQTLEDLYSTVFANFCVGK